MIRRLKYWLAGVDGQRTKGPAMPGARKSEDGGLRPETDMMNFDAFLETPTGTKLIATLHDFTVGQALVPVERTQ